MKLGFIVGAVIVIIASLALSIYVFQPKEELSKDDAIRIALDFLYQKSSTFKFDGIKDSVRVLDTYKEEKNWIVIISFQSRHAGYGDRTGKILAQVITPHKIEIKVNGDGSIVKAVIDGKWDELEQKIIS